MKTIFFTMIFSLVSTVALAAEVKCESLNGHELSFHFTDDETVLVKLVSPTGIAAGTGRVIDETESYFYHTIKIADLGPEFPADSLLTLIKKERNCRRASCSSFGKIFTSAKLSGGNEEIRFNCL